MTAKEKLSIQLYISRVIHKILCKYDLHVMDVVNILLGVTCAYMDMFASDYIAGCKKNIVKRRRVTNEIIAKYLDYRLSPNPDPKSPYAFKDDEDGQSDVQE